MRSRAAVYFVKFHKDVVRPGVMQLIFDKLFKIALFCAVSGWHSGQGRRAASWVEGGF
jgi:hypothetical protein